jgi:hypothetical protein
MRFEAIRLDLVIGHGKLEALADVLLENVGLVHLDLRHCTMYDGCWTTLCALFPNNQHFGRLYLKTCTMKMIVGS